MWIPILERPPRTVCIQRLSAIGDTCHALAVVRALQDAWPETRFTWLIGRQEHRLLALARDIEFITVDKKAGIGALRSLRAAFAGRRFDLSLAMQVALRANLYGLFVRAPVRVGFDRARAREGQWLFTTHRIAPGAREHVLDGLLGFARVLGVRPPALRWDLSPAESDRAHARRLVPDDCPTLLISPCSSHSGRNWSAEGYAAIADHAASELRLRVVLVGGPSATERTMTDRILSLCRSAPVDHVGRDTLPGLLAALERAAVLVTPDSGPAHMATMVGLPVVGLYAATNPARSGPYLSRQWCVDRFAAAARRFRGRDPEDLPWATKIEEPGVMDLIPVDAVKERLAAALRASPRC